MAMPPVPVVDDSHSPADVGPLFHRLNNQLGIILANAELLETKAADDMSRRRAAQVVSSVLDAMTTAKDIRALLRSV
jgi:hypothetical protein